MKYALILLGALAMTGCATTQIPKTIEIPVPVPCKTPEPPAPTYKFVPPYSTPFEGARDLLGDRDVSMAYELELRAALKSCK